MSPNKLPYTGFINEGVEKVLEFEPLFLGTEERSIEVDEAKIAAMAEYRKVGRLLGDLPGNEQINFELTEPEDDDVGDIQTANFVRFRKDQPDWACVFGLCNGPTRVRFVHVPNRIYQTLAAIIFKYYAHGSVIHIDGWRGYTP